MQSATANTITTDISENICNYLYWIREDTVLKGKITSFALLCYCNILNTNQVHGYIRNTTLDFCCDVITQLRFNEKNMTNMETMLWSTRIQQVPCVNCCLVYV